MTISFILNDVLVETDCAPGLSLLDFVRYQKNLKGTKIGCREGDCGACTALVGQLEDGVLRYHSVTSCLMPIGNANGKHIVTVEGINQDKLNPIQQAFVDFGASQCGFCTPGFIMSLVGYALTAEKPNYQEAVDSIDGNICRCTGYHAIFRAIEHFISHLQAVPKKDKFIWLYENNYIPPYFLQIQTRMEKLNTVTVSDETKQKQMIGAGTDLMVQRPEQIANSELHFVSQNHKYEIYEKDGKIHVDAAATVEELRESPIFNQIFPKMHAWMKLVSSTPIRNMATLAGNFVNASPIGDLTIFFLALSPTLTLKASNGDTRELAMKDLYLGYKKLAMQEGESIASIHFKKPAKETMHNFEKVSKRTFLDIASVNSAVSLRMEQNKVKEITISAGGVFEHPFLLKKTANFMIGKEINEGTLNQAFQIMQDEIKPICDVRGDEKYKRLLLRQLVFSHFYELGFTELKLEAC